MDRGFEQIVGEIQELYKADSRPWVIGFSGGKDSTALLQLVFLAIRNLSPSDRKKQVHVVSNDTRVEIPQVSVMVLDALAKIEAAAEQDELPIVVAQTTPEIDQTFFVNLIGRGYPSPNSRFRWCTERMKIDPTSSYIQKVVNERGEVIILLGARKSESATRAQVMESYSIEGSALRRHSTLPRCFVYTPIEDWTTREVWAFLLQARSPWGGDNKALFRLYSKAEGGECPLVIDTTTPSCGNSRFGCWVCTVVEQDKAVAGFIDSGETDLEPLLQFRTFLKDIRTRRDWRERIRKNGNVRNQKGEEVWGPFTLEARKEILRRLLETEQKVGYQLISIDELLLIQRFWKQGGRSLTGPTADTEFSVAKILRDVRGDSVMSGYLDLLEEGPDPLLEQICEKYGLKAELIERLKAEEEAVAHQKRRDSLFQKIDEILDSMGSA
jgi:DNA sulfur modification protein DndC